MRIMKLLAQCQFHTILHEQILNFHFSFQELNKKNIQTVSTILVSFGRCIKNISISGQYGPLTLVKQGLVQKISIKYIAYSYKGNMIKGSNN